MPIQYLLVLAMLIALSVVWKRLREGVIGFREAILWSIVWIAAGVVVILPETTSVLARVLGVGRGVDVAVYAGIVLLFFLVFKIFIHLDRLEAKMTELVRHDALRGLEAGDDCCGGNCKDGCCDQKEGTSV